MFHYIYVLPWRYILLLMPVMMISTIALVLGANRILKRTKWLYITLFIIWVVTVIYVTIASRATGDYLVSLKPFASYVWALEQPEYYRTNFMNILLFFPGGIMLTLSMTKVKKKKHKLIATVLILMAISVSVEMVQFFFSKGTVEIDDVLHNTLGAAFGCGAAVLAERSVLLLQNKIKLA